MSKSGYYWVRLKDESQPSVAYNDGLGNWWTWGCIHAVIVSDILSNTPISTEPSQVMNKMKSKRNPGWYRVRKGNQWYIAAWSVQTWHMSFDSTYLNSYWDEIIETPIDPSPAPQVTEKENKDLFQCPYDKATLCKMTDGCYGCEEWAKKRPEPKQVTDEEIWEIAKDYHSTWKGHTQQEQYDFVNGGMAIRNLLTTPTGEKGEK